jgi:hypothetical protein
MALIIRNLPADTTLVRRLRVVGVRGTLSPSESQTELERLLHAHQFTRGFELVAPGTPTNSLPGARAAYTSRPSPEDIVEVNQRRHLVGGAASPLCQPQDDRDGTLLANMLGIDVATFAYVKRADATVQQDAIRMRAILSAATQRALVRHFSGAVAAETVREILGFGIARVNALGPLPVVRVGPQPYGILPVIRRNANRMRAGSNARRYLPALERLRPHWEAATASVDRVGKPGADPARTLIGLLRQDGVARRIGFRPFVGPELGQLAAPTMTTAERTACRFSATRPSRSSVRWVSAPRPRPPSFARSTCHLRPSSRCRSSSQRMRRQAQCRSPRTIWSW